MFGDIAQEVIIEDLIKYFKKMDDETISVKEVIKILNKFKKDIG